MFDLTKNKSKLFLILILSLAFFLRLYGLNRVPVSLFADEVDVGYQAYSIIKTGKDYMGNPWPLHFQSYSDMRTPLYIYTSVPTVAIFGITPLGVRLPAAIFGILGVWGIYLLVNELLSYQVTKKSTNRSPITERKAPSSAYHRSLALVASAVLALSPWHLQYSRAAFEVTMLLAFYLFGLYFFFRALKEGKFLWGSVSLIASTAWIYSTAKLFTPLFLLVIFALWKKEIFALGKGALLKAIFTGFIILVPIFLSILFGGGAARFNYISVFSDPTTAPEVDYARLVDAQVRGSEGNIIPKIASRIVHNKGAFWIEKIVGNIFNALSFDFLFAEGDPNLRHSIKGVGQFYWVEAVALLLGLIYFFGFFKSRRVKILIGFWILAGIIPSAITRDGGTHATRLILILPPLLFLISYGLLYGAIRVKTFGKLLLLLYFGIWVLEFGFYQHYYWVHNPWQTERQWHAGFSEAIDGVRELEGGYKKIIVSDKFEPPKIFFAGFYPYPPGVWQQGFVKTNLPGFDYLEQVDKFYFGHAGPIKISELHGYLEDDTLYVASAVEIPENLIREPEKVPGGLALIKSVAFPSGEPAFYFFERER